MNVIDWTAWGITISHMAAIGIDRLLAIVQFHRYPRIMTVARIRFFSVFSWTLFSVANVMFVAKKLCCPIVPVPEYYTFDYELPKLRDGLKILRHLKTAFNPGKTQSNQDLKKDSGR